MNQAIQTAIDVGFTLDEIKQSAADLKGMKSKSWPERNKAIRKSVEPVCRLLGVTAPEYADMDAWNRMDVVFTAAVAEV